MKFDTAFEFHAKVIKAAGPSQLFAILTSSFNYYFFSHMEQISLSKLAKSDVIVHFCDFFGYMLTLQGDESLSAVYSSYYVI